MLGLSSSYFAFRKKGIYDSAKSIFGMGFSTAELGAAHQPEKDVFETLKKIKHDFSDKHFTLHGLFPPMEKRAWFNPSLGLTAENKKVIDGFFRAASILEAGVVSIHPGFTKQLFWKESKKDLVDAVFGKEIPRESAWKGLFGVMREFEKGAKETGFVFAIENIPMIGAPLVYSTADFEKAFNAFPETRLLLDTGHAWFEENLEELLENFGERVGQLHLHYSRGKSVQNQSDEHLPIPSLEQIEPLKAIRQFRRIPVIFEHGGNTSEAQILAEKKIAEEFEEALG